MGFVDINARVEGVPLLCKEALENGIVGRCK